jgi:hypothetical protein
LALDCGDPLKTRRVNGAHRGPCTEDTLTFPVASDLSRKSKYEIHQEAERKGRDRVHFALAFGNSDPDFITDLSVARLHINLGSK